MNIEVVKVSNYNEVEVGDIVESKISGYKYLIFKIGDDSYKSLQIENLELSRIEFDNIAELLEHLFFDGYIIHKKENIKLVINI